MVDPLDGVYDGIAVAGRIKPRLREVVASSTTRRFAPLSRLRERGRGEGRSMASTTWRRFVDASALTPTPLPLRGRGERMREAVARSNTFAPRRFAPLSRLRERGRGRGQEHGKHDKTTLRGCFGPLTHPSPTARERGPYA
ncbi:hypothetical protein CBM2629_B40436 [Cupriavidus taiwanensis]|nr:hypothetical protein CBM2629_B40436 [Cupriavidus taiwanensis]